MKGMYLINYVEFLFGSGENKGLDFFLIEKNEGKKVGENRGFCFFFKFYKFRFCFFVFYEVRVLFKEFGGFIKNRLVYGVRW